MPDIGNGRAGRADVVIVEGDSAGGVLAGRLSEDPTRSSVWDGAITESGRAVDFTSADFLGIEDGIAAEHWDTVDYIRLYSPSGSCPADLRDV